MLLIPKCSILLAIVCLDVLWYVNYGCLPLELIDLSQQSLSVFPICDLLDLNNRKLTTPYFTLRETSYSLRTNISFYVSILC